jgi:tripeptidyl-peptidase-1
MKYAILTGLLALAGVNAKSTSHVEDVLVENLHRVPQGWNEVGVPAQSRKLHFRIAIHSVSTIISFAYMWSLCLPANAFRVARVRLRMFQFLFANPSQPNHDLFEQTLMEISTPSHSRYGQHLKRDELKQLIKPRAESTNAVLSWLEDSGIPSEDIVDDGEWINFVATVSTAEEMLDTKFKSYQNVNRPDVKKIRTLHYSVPKAVSKHIDLIQPTTRFAQLRPQSNNIHDQEEVPFTIAAVNATCGASITPQCLADLYNFADYTPGNASVLVGVTGYLEQYARYKDWAQFASTFAPNAAGSNFTWSSISGLFVT